MTTRFLPVDQVILIHREFVAAGPLIDRGRLETAVHAPFVGTFEREFYPTVTQKAVKLVDSISRAQAFQDGNKRLAWFSMMVFIEINGMTMSASVSQEEAAAWVMGLEGDEAGLREGSLWLNCRLESLA